MKIGNKFSSLASDPLRGFRFYAEFSAPSGKDVPFSKNIITADRNANGDPTETTGFVGGFTQIGGLQVNVQDITYREGGFNITTHHVPGMVTFPPVVFQRGVLFGNDQAITWLRGLVRVSNGSGMNGRGTGAAVGDKVPGGFRVNVNIYAAEHPNTSDTLVPVMGWKLHNAYLTNLTYTDLNSVGNELMFETMTLVHEGLSVFFTNRDGTARAMNSGLSTVDNPTED
jgi:phage tail-like protein